MRTSCCRRFVRLLTNLERYQKSVTLEEIDSAESLASNLEKIDLPDHLVSVLVDPLLQKFMMLRPDQDLQRALAWMNSQLAELLNGDADEEAMLNTMNVIYEYARSTKVGVRTSELLHYAF